MALAHVKSSRMQRLLLILIGLLFLCAGKHTRNPGVTITGKITGTVPDRIEYTLPINGITYFGFENSVQPDALGNFKIFLPIEKACFIELSNGYAAYGTVIAEPGMTYTLNINTENKKNDFVVECANKEGQQLYNQNINRSMISGHFEEAAAEYRNNTKPDSIKESIRKRRETEIARYRKLLSAGVVSKGFYDLVSTDRSYFYAGAQSSVALLNHLLSERNLNTLNLQAYSVLWREVFEDYPVSNPDLIRSPWFFYFTQSYLQYKSLIENGVNFNTLSEIRKQGLIHTHNINIARKYLSGKQLEYYYAAYLYFEAVNKNYEKELIELFEDFRDQYPLSEYTHFVESEIIPIIAFHKKQSDAPNERIHILDNFESISSLKEAAKKLGAESVYIDVWATWCGPCKKEFTHNSELYKLLKKEGVAMLYVSVDKDEKHVKWMEMMKYYQLEGYHVRAGSKLIDDLQRLRGGDSFSIPWHILTDGDGNVLIKYAGAPSDIRTLEKQLSKSRHMPAGNTNAE